MTNKQTSSSSSFHSSSSSLADSQRDVENAFQNALEDVHTRFILNLPPEELATTDRIFFQLEQAWWYYEDIICDEMDDPSSSNTAATTTWMDMSAGQGGAATTAATDTVTSTPITKEVRVATSASVDLPRFPKLQPFCRKMFEISPLLSPLLGQFDELWAEFSQYRRKISTYGTILLNQDCTAVVLCQDYNGKSWTFPAGKVNQGETGIEAGARETYEETGFDPNCNMGLTKAMREVNENLPWNSLREEDALRYTEGGGSGKLRTCYVCHGVPEEFPFAPVARKEVSDVRWHDLNDLPKKSFAVIPFLKGLKHWIRRNAVASARKGEGGSAVKGRSASNKREKSTSRSMKRDVSGKRERGSGGSSSRYSTPGKNSVISDADSDLILSGLGKVGQDNRWSEEDMFRVNEKLIGRKIEYDGNPQVFATKGFNGVDPHAFRVVGGGFMNSGKDELAPAPTLDKLQPLFRSQGRGDREDGNYHDGGYDDDSDGTLSEDDLKPFFSDAGATPWGEVVMEAKSPARSKRQPRDEKINSKSASSSVTSSSVASVERHVPSGDSVGTNASGLAILTMLRGSDVVADDVAPRTIPAVDEHEKKGLDYYVTTHGETTEKSQAENIHSGDDHENDRLDFFMTDREITEKSQREKMAKSDNNRRDEVMTDKEHTEKNLNPKIESLVTEQDQEREEDHFARLLDWVKSLPESKPSKYFGDFRFDVDAIMQAMT